jgi:hypothetical protein
VHEVVWDRVGDDEAHGLSSTYHEVAVPASAATVPGRLNQVRTERLDGDCLRGRLVG